MPCDIKNPVGESAYGTVKKLRRAGDTLTCGTRKKVNVQ